MTRGFQLWLLLAVLVGAILRCAELGSRPMHTDESVNAMNFGQLWRDGYYRYDPEEHHGPALAYANLAWQKLTQAPNFLLWSDARLRSLTVLFGIGLIALLALLTDGLGKNGALAAAFLTAVSPVMVYYSRDYIHEMLLVFFTLLALAAGWRYFRERKLRWILLAGAATGLMQATKETFVFNLVAAGAAIALNKFFLPPPPVKTKNPKPTGDSWKLVAGAAAWLVIVLLLFSSFAANPHGPLDALRTYRYWAQSAAGASPHVHEWSFYAQRLFFFHQPGGPIWSEAFILVLAIGGGFVAFGRSEAGGGNKTFLRFLVLYTVILTAIYTALPYKTPWCLLGFWDGAILLAGVAAAELFARMRQPRLKLASGLILLTGTGQLGFQAWQAAIPFAADQHSPWCYAQTSPDLLHLVQKVNGLSQASPDGHGMRINVYASNSDYYPLPWYLRQFGNSIGWWDQVQGYSKFSGDEIDPEALAAKLRRKSEGVSQFLMDSTLGKYAEITAAPIFSEGDIKDLPSFAVKLTGKSDAVSDYLNQHLDEKTKSALATIQGTVQPSPALEAMLIQSLNTIVGRDSIYDSNRFAGVKLRSSTEEFRESLTNSPQNLENRDFARLNRLLLEDTYPNELRKSDVAAILVTNLNQILAGPSLYNSDRFQNIHLRPDTQTLRHQNPTGQDLIRLNRMLLEDTYTDAISALLPPQEIYPAVTIVSSQLEPDIDSSKAGIMAGIFELRPKVFLELYVQTNLWKAYLPSQLYDDHGSPPPAGNKAAEKRL